MRNILFRIILDDALLLGLASLYAYKCITKKKLIEKFDQQEDFILKIVVFILAICLFVTVVLPTLMDIPNCINGNYIIVEGISQQSIGRNGLDRRIEVLDTDTQQIVEVVFPYDPGVKRGDYLIVQCVPHSGYGVLLEINGEKVHDLHPTIR